MYFTILYLKDNSKQGGPSFLLLLDLVFNLGSCKSIASPGH